MNQSPHHPFDLRPSTSDFAVVGGGLLGMTLALRLAQAGVRVTLYEGAPALGGLAGTWNLNGIEWDKHYHVTLMSDTATRALVSELGLENDLRWVETRTGFFTDGRLYSMSNTMEFLRFPPLRLSDKMRLGATIFYASRIKDWRRLEQIPVADWLQKLSGKRTFERMWLPLLRAKLGDNYTQVSAAFIWATIARMYAARRTGLKREMFGYVEGGYARIIEAFTRKLKESGVHIEYGHTLKSVSRDAVSDTSSDTDGIRLEFTNGACATFDRAALTIPSKVAAGVCEGLRDDERERLNRLKYQGIICASVLLKRPLANFYVTNITDADSPFTAVIEMTALVAPETFGGNALVYLPKYVDPDDAMFDLSDDEIKHKFLTGLARMYPHFDLDDVLAFQVSRVRHVFPLPTLDYTARLPPIATSIPGLHIVNSSHITNGTLNVNETIQLAERTARELDLESETRTK